MRRSQTITIQIEAPYGAVHDYLGVPENYPEWAAVDPASFRRLESGDWVAEVRFGGLRHIRFAPANPFGVFDHAVFAPGETPLWMPMRLTPLDEGCELTFTFRQRDSMTDESFNSTLEWVTTDFWALKSLLEARFGAPLPRKKGP